MATYSSVLAWRIPGTGEPGGLLSMGSHRVKHDWSDLAAVAVSVHKKKKKTFSHSSNTLSVSETEPRNKVSWCLNYIDHVVDNLVVNHGKKIWVSNMSWNPTKQLGKVEFIFKFSNTWL